MWKKYIFSLVVLSAILSLLFLSSSVRKARGKSPQAQQAGYKLLGQFRPTFYRILDESADEWSDEDATVPVLTPDGDVIKEVGARFKRHLDIEGSGRLSDGRIVNIARKVDGEARYSVVRNAPFGLGDHGYKLIPFRTLAVDPQVIPLGTVLYVPELVGVHLPSGEVHDGYVFAHDTGAGINGNRIDVFVGFENDVDNTLTRARRIGDMQQMEIYQVDDETAARLNQRFHSQFRVR
jgi:3D (Asp-Asp-Asp) domain-containing protein